jgi:cell division protein FtsW
MLLAAGARLWHFLVFIPPLAAGAVVLIVTNPYRLTRIETFLDPYMQPQGSGYHMIQSMLAVSGGEGFGRGLGYGLQKFGYLPEDTTDFLFAIICEELGIAGAAVVIFLYIAMLWAGLAIVKRQTSVVLKLLGLGIISTVGFQALINLAVVTGLGPTKGIALPLVSSGGTGWILTAASLGLLVAMDALVADEPEEDAEAVPAAALAA